MRLIHRIDDNRQCRVRRSYLTLLPVILCWKKKKRPILVIGQSWAVRIATDDSSRAKSFCELENKINCNFSKCMQNLTATLSMLFEKHVPNAQCHPPDLLWIQLFLMHVIHLYNGQTVHRRLQRCLLFFAKKFPFDLQNNQNIPNWNLYSMELGIFSSEIDVNAHNSISANHIDT